MNEDDTCCKTKICKTCKQKYERRYEFVKRNTCHPCESKYLAEKTRKSDTKRRIIKTLNNVNSSLNMTISEDNLNMVIKAYGGKCVITHFDLKYDTRTIAYRPSFLPRVLGGIVSDPSDLILVSSMIVARLAKQGYKENDDDEDRCVIKALRRPEVIGRISEGRRRLQAMGEEARRTPTTHPK